jgi:hypothetical protein
MHMSLWNLSAFGSFCALSAKDGKEQTEKHLLVGQFGTNSLFYNCNRFLEWVH